MNGLDEEELPATEGDNNVEIERAAAMAAEIACEIVKDELTIPLLKEFCEWMHSLVSCTV